MNFEKIKTAFVKAFNGIETAHGTATLKGLSLIEAKANASLTMENAAVLRKSIADITAILASDKMPNVNLENASEKKAFNNIRSVYATFLNRSFMLGLVAIHQGQTPEKMLNDWGIVAVEKFARETFLDIFKPRAPRNKGDGGGNGDGGNGGGDGGDGGNGGGNGGEPTPRINLTPNQAELIEYIVKGDYHRLIHRVFAQHRSDDDEFVSLVAEVAPYVAEVAKRKPAEAPAEAQAEVAPKPKRQRKTAAKK